MSSIQASVQSPPRVLVVLPGLFPSTYLGVLKPLLALHRGASIELDLQLEWLLDREALGWADVVVLSRNENPQYRWILDDCSRRGMPLIYDLDDNLLALEEEGSATSREGRSGSYRQISAYLRGASLIRVYSPVLYDHLGPRFGKVVRAHGPVDWSLVRPAAPGGQGPVRIVYATSRLDDKLGEWLAEPIHRILAEHQEVRFVVWGPRIKSLQRARGVKRHGRTLDYERFFRAFAAASFEIGLAPLAQDFFHSCKSNNKFREQAACGIAGIYSDSDVYREDVEHEKTGLVVGPSADDWYSAMNRLIRDEQLRRGIQARAHALVRERYSMERSAQEWLRDILAVVESRSSTEPGLAAMAGSRSRPKKRRVGKRFRGIDLTAKRLISLMPQTWSVARRQPRQALERAMIHVYGAIKVRALRKYLKQGGNK